jgi:hypothetical protein
LRQRGLDFDEAVEVFGGWTIDIPDLRRDYGERRINTVGYLRGRMMIVCWTPRGDNRHIISKSLSGNIKRDCKVFGA